MADYVSKYTGNEVDGILDEAIELPQATSDDNGKFLKYDSGSVIWDNPIDTSNASDGDVLKYNSNYGFTWDSLSEGLPVHNNGEFDSSILTINNYGDVAWYKAQTNANDGDFLIYRDNAGIIWDNPLDTNEASEGDFLRYGSNGLEWDNPLDTDGASQGQCLKYAGDTHDLEWGDPIDTYEASEGDFLRYGSNGLEWDNPLDTSNANSGDFLKYGSEGLEWDDPLNISNAESGDFLKYGSDGIEWDNPLDITGANNGDLLRYSSNSGIIWDSPFELNNVNSGSFLSFNNDGPLWVTPDNAESASAGEVFTILSVAGSGNFAYTWSRILPTYDSSDNGSDVGKVLTVNSSGQLGWYSLSEIQSNSI